ncbi:MAG: 30S ribosomal protein S27ae [Candidatus Aenigmatarchaeota archaeon]
MFKIKDGKVERERKYCPRCGDSFLSTHKDRYYCGKCKYTEFVKV